MADRVIQRNDTAARWQSINPVLAQGELGIVSDGAKGYKIGDGVTAWNSLEYPANPASVVQELGNSETAVISQKAITNITYNRKEELIPYNVYWEQGSVDSNFSRIVSANRLRTQFIPVNTNKALNFTVGNSDFKVNVIGFKESGEIVIMNTDVSSYNSLINVSETPYICLILKKTDNSDITLSDVSTVGLTINSLPIIDGNYIQGINNKINLDNFLFQGYYDSITNTTVTSPLRVSSKTLRGNIDIKCNDGFMVREIVWLNEGGKYITSEAINSQSYQRDILPSHLYKIVFARTDINQSLDIRDDIIEYIRIGNIESSINAALKIAQGGFSDSSFVISNDRVYTEKPIKGAFEIATNDGFIIRYVAVVLRDGTRAVVGDASTTRTSFSLKNVQPGACFYVTFTRPDISAPISPDEDIVKYLHTENCVYYNRYNYQNTGYYDFQVLVNTSVPNVVDNTLNLQDSQIFEIDNGRIYLPITYKPEGEKTRLIIHCHGASQNYNTGAIFPKSSSMLTIDYLLAKGYAVMDVNGMPGINDFYATTGANPIAYYSYIQAYNWVISNFNIHKEVFVVGISAGSLPALQIANIGTIPVLASAIYCGVLDFSRIWMLLGGYHPNNQGPKIKEYLSNKYGFIGTKPTFGNVDPCSDVEWEYIMDNIPQFEGWNTYTSDIKTSMTQEEYKNILDSIYNHNYPSWINSNGRFDSIQQMLLAFKIPQRGDLSSYSSMIEAEGKLYNSCSIYNKTPLKLFHALDDDIAPYRYAKYYFDMCKRGGSVVDLRTFSSGGHMPTGNTISISVNGVNISTNVLTVECLDWLQRFEK